MDSEYRVPSAPVETTLEIKRSRFVTCVQAAQCVQDAHDAIAAQRREHPDANHVCWAYIAGVPGSTTDLGCSDDGEPSGTAGKPMLNVLQHGDIAFVVATTARYFGGTKLGTGGLVRAYTQSVVNALNELQTAVWQPRVTTHVTAPFALESTLRQLAASHRAEITQVSYNDGVAMTLSLEAARLPELASALADASAGAIRVASP